MKFGGSQVRRTLPAARLNVSVFKSSAPPVLISSSRHFAWLHVSKFRDGLARMASDSARD